MRDYRPRVVSEIMDGTCWPEENVTMIVHHAPGLSQHNIYLEKSISRLFYAEASWKSYGYRFHLFFFLEAIPSSDVGDSGHL